MGRMAKDHQLPMLVVDTGPFSKQKNREQVKLDDGGSSLFWRERVEEQDRALGGELEKKKKKTIERLS